ncbi:TPA: PI-2a pilus subunit PilC [Streptococcus agalactiae]
MKKIRKSLGLLLCCFLGLVQLAFFSVASVNADTPNQLTITQIGLQPNTTEEGISYRLWTVTDNLKVDLLSQMTDSELNQKYKSILTSPTDTNSQTKIALPNGSYFGRAYKADQSVSTIVPFYIELPDDKLSNQLQINPKRKVETGRLKLIKYTKEGKIKKRLSGVIFVLYDNQNQPVRFKNGRFTTDQDGITSLVTDDKGEIEVEGLLPGKYIFREAKALTGYRISMKDAVVAVVANKTQEVEVENEKETPPPTNPKPSQPLFPQSFLPKTGMIIGGGLTILGCIILGILFIFLRKTKNSKSERNDTV